MQVPPLNAPLEPSKKFTTPSPLLINHETDARKRLDNYINLGALNRRDSHDVQLETKGHDLINHKKNKQFDHANAQEFQSAARRLISDVKDRLKQDNLEPHERQELENFILETDTLLIESRKNTTLFLAKQSNVAPKTSQQPGEKQFYENLQKTGLSKLYNATHPDKPVPKGGGESSEIEGVEFNVGEIEGLFDTPESLFETIHAFFIPMADATGLLFTEQEVCQILYELAIGIYVYDTVPFSFLRDANLFPEIHPAYENTLVGEVFSMVSRLIGQVIDKKHKKENPLLRDYTKISKSFHITAKQNKFTKTDHLFVLDGGLDVKYSIPPDSYDKKTLEVYYKLYGEYPQAYDGLIQSYEEIRQEIQGHSLCEKNFEMLNFINFFSYYFTTLKKHRKIPLLPQVTLTSARSTLFPPLPLMILPSEQTNVEREHEKKVLGECGMRMKSLTVEKSLQGTEVVNHILSIGLQSGRLAFFKDDQSTLPNGALFSLAFDDMPLGLGEDPHELETLFTNMIQGRSIEAPINKLISLMARNQQDLFLAEINQQDCKEEKDSSGRTLLHHAVMNKEIFFTEELIKKGYSLDTRDGKGYLPIHYAAMSNSIIQLITLLDSKPDHLRSSYLNAQTNHGATPLIVAIQHGHVEMVKFLCSQGANANALLKDGYTTLHCAVHTGNHAIVGIYPYSTQILALLGVLIGGESRQAQIKTGEGKSIIVALFAFVQAMECHALDIITSSRYLAIRDQKKFATFFERCGVTTSHICSDRKEPHQFKYQVIYAPAFDFEFAWMQDYLWDTKLFEERLKAPFVKRNFDAACVDESDNLLIDSAATVARLSFPTEISYDWIYAPILLFVKQQCNEHTSTAAFKNLITPMRNFICQKVNQKNQKLCALILDSQMETWLTSASTALFVKKENIHYIIKQVVDEGKKIPTRKILIIDSITSRISENSRWSEGLHEFLEVKHDITVKKESLIPIFLPHSVFYKFYETITALTGTAEHDQTARFYHMITFHVPPHLPSIREDLPPIFAENAREYTTAILKTARKCIQEGRPLLFVCATIQDTIDLEKIMQDNNISCELLNEIQKDSEEAIIERAGIPGKITIATTVAGRGTDIILKPASLLNGGLHVALLFFPASDREEQQAIGRAGRQGQPGSSQMILHKADPTIRKKLPFNLAMDMIQPESELIELFNHYEQQTKILLSNLGMSERFFLDQYRNNVQRIQNIFYLKRVNMERFLATKAHPFFAKFQAWYTQVNDKKFLADQSQRLCMKGITKAKSDSLDFSHLQKDRAVAEEFKRLLSSKHDELPWKAFLNLVINSIKQQVITAWALEFSQPAERMVHSVAESEDEIKRKVQDLLNSYLSKWEKYLDPNGFGIFIYLQELTTIDYAPNQKIVPKPKK